MLHSIQALRILSALWVVLYHTRDSALLAPASGPWQAFIGFGYLGVDVFFVISGFIMAMNTAERPPGGRSALQFAATRCARIYSGWWPVFLLCLLVYGSAGQLQGKDLLGSFWLYQLNFNVLVLPVTWTLTFELYFYALVTLSLFAPSHWRQRIFWACLAVLAAANAWWLATDRYTVEQFGRSHYGMHLFLSPLCLEFLLGYLLQRHHQRLRLPAPVLAVLTLASAAVLYWYATHMAHKPSGLSGFFHFPERAVLAGLLAACLLGLFLALEDRLPRRLSLWGGDISYMVYLVHLPTLWLFERFVAPLLPASAALGTVVALAMVLMLSSLLHLAAERPAYRWFKRLAAREQGTMAPVMQHTGKNEEIQALRAIGIGLVIIGHLHGLFFWEPRWLGIGKGFWVGVDLFLCVSGYVIARNLVPRLADKTGTAFWREAAAFWVRRLYRITPSAWLWLALPLAMGPWLVQAGNRGISAPNLADAAAALLHVANFHFYDCTQGRGQCGDFALYWSLSLEEQFYLLLPLLVLLLRKWLVPALIAVVLAQVFLQRAVWADWLWFVRSDAIVLGVLIAIFSRTDTWRALDPKLTASRLRFIIPLLLLFGLVASTRYDVVSFSTGLAAIVSAIIVWLCSYQAGYFIRSRWMLSLLGWIGDRSYAIYLIHIPAFWVTRELWTRLSPTGTVFDAGFTLPFALTAAALTLALAELNYRLLEEPLRRRGAERARRIVAAGTQTA